MQIYYEPGYLYKDELGNCMEYPEYYEKTIRKQNKLHKKLVRQVEGSNNSKETQRKIMETERVLKEQAKQIVRTEANRLLEEYGVVVGDPVDASVKARKGEIPTRRNYNTLLRILRQKQDNIRNY